MSCNRADSFTRGTDRLRICGISGKDDANRKSKNPIRDLKFAVRQLAKNPGFTAVAVLALALGVGANTTIFSLVNGVLLRPLNYHESEQLVRLNESNVKLGFPTFSVAPGTFLDWQIQNHVFTDLAAISSSNFNLTGVEKPELVSGLRVSANLFSLLKVHPELGRLGGLRISD